MGLSIKWDIRLATRSWLWKWVASESITCCNIIPYCDVALCVENSIHTEWGERAETTVDGPGGGHEQHRLHSHRPVLWSLVQRGVAPCCHSCVFVGSQLIFFAGRLLDLHGSYVDFSWQVLSSCASRSTQLYSWGNIRKNYVCGMCVPCGFDLWSLEYYRIHQCAFMYGVNVWVQYVHVSNFLQTVKALSYLKDNLKIIHRGKCNMTLLLRNATKLNFSLNIFQTLSHPTFFLILKAI